MRTSMRTSESGLRLGLVLLAASAGRRLLFGLVGAAGLGLVAMVGCHGNPPTPAAGDPNAAAQNSPTDPADANLAPVNGAGNTTQVLGQSDQGTTSQSSQEYPQQQAPPPDQGQGNPGYSSNPGYQGYPDQNAQAGYDATLTDEQASEPPPPLPVYDQPEAPDPNVLWTPGYWAYGPGGYYWVPGAWCAAPYVGALWTPGYWGYYGGHYRFHHGFWGPHIGYYGGVNYGFGYVGVGYLGGYWLGSSFNYNRNFNRVGPNIRNVYVRNETFNNVHYNSYEVNTRIGPRVSYNGGNGGIRATPRPAELAALREPRVAPMQSQVQAVRAAAGNRQQFYAANHGQPAIAAAPRPFAAERGIAAPARTTANLPRPELQARPGQPGAVENRPAETVRPGEARPVQPVQPGRPIENRPGAPAAGSRPGQPVPQPQPQGRPGANPQRPAASAPAQSEVRRVPQRPVEPQRAQPAPAPQNRPQPAPRPQPVQPQARPQAPAQRPAPQPQARPAQPQPRPQPQARPAPEQAQPRPQPPPRPQSQARPQAPPQPRPEPHDGNRPKP